MCTNTNRKAPLVMSKRAPLPASSCPLPCPLHPAPSHVSGSPAARSLVTFSRPPAGRKPVLRQRLTQRGRKRRGWREVQRKVRIQIFISAVVPVRPSVRPSFLLVPFLHIFSTFFFLFLALLSAWTQHTSSSLTLAPIRTDLWR